MSQMSHGLTHDEVRIYRVSDLNQDTAGVLRQINEAGRPAMVTKHGRFVAMITPLEGRNIEGRLLNSLLSHNELGPQPTRSTDAVAHALGVNLP